MIRFLALAAFLCSFALLCPAQVLRTDGCYVAATGRVYVGTSCIYYLQVCDGRDYEFAIRSNTSNTNCSMICRENVSSPFMSITGKRTNYTVYQCPLDGSISVLALLSATVAFYFKARRTQLALEI
jgi:hypothetical protein